MISGTEVENCRQQRVKCGVSVWEEGVHQRDSRLAFGNKATEVRLRWFGRVERRVSEYQG